MDDKLSRQGHRKRMRENYIQNGIDTLKDYSVIELYLSLVIPQKDVKPLAYELINVFGNLENVVNASVEDLMQVNGIGESSAVAISLIKDINKRVNLNKNRDITKLSNSEVSKQYVSNMLKNQNNEKFVLITLDNSLNIINDYIIADGVVNSIRIEPKKIVEKVIKDNAASIIIAHNHPKGEAKPSAADLDFTLKILDLMRKIDVRLNDHIIVGENDVLSLNSDSRYMMYFD